jgi:hypothetical protein
VWPPLLQANRIVLSSVWFWPRRKQQKLESLENWNYQILCLIKSVQCRLKAERRDLNITSLASWFFGIWVPLLLRSVGCERWEVVPISWHFPFDPSSPAAFFRFLSSALLCCPSLSPMMSERGESQDQEREWRLTISWRASNRKTREPSNRLLPRHPPQTHLRIIPRVDPHPAPTTPIDALRGVGSVGCRWGRVFSLMTQEGERNSYQWNVCERSFCSIEWAKNGWRRMCHKS